MTVEDLTKQEQRAKPEHFDNYIYLVMHALAYEGDPHRLSSHEVEVEGQTRNRWFLNVMALSDVYLHVSEAAHVFQMIAPERWPRGA